MFQKPRHIFNLRKVIQSTLRLVRYLIRHPSQRRHDQQDDVWHHVNVDLVNHASKALHAALTDGGVRGLKKR